MDSNGRANVLLVDDRPENLVALEAILEPLGQRLVTADSGEEALRRLLDEEFAVILLDVQMPNLDGFETAALIKERQRTRTVPIIFLTAISKESAHVFRGYSAGAVDYLFKPFDPAILRSKVAVFIELHQKTEQLKRQAELLRQRELETLRRQSEEQYRALADSMPQMVWMAREDGLIEYFNRRWYEYTGRADTTDTNAVTHPEDRQRVLDAWAGAVESGEPYVSEFRLQRGSDGAFLWHLGRAVPIHDETGAIAHWVGTATDIDEQKRREQAQRFLVEAGSVLGSSLDYRRTLVDVAALAVPEIADWCAVDVLEDDGSLSQLAIAHADPEKVKFAQELSRRYPPDREATRGTAQVIRTGEAELVREISPEQLATVATDELHLELLRELGLRSYMCVPLVARERTLGAITFISAELGRLYDEDDLVLAQELAARAAMAVDNAHLYAESEERGRAARVVNSIGDGVFVVDREGTIQLWNRAAEAITGLTQGDMEGAHAASAIGGWDGVVERIPVVSTENREEVAAETVPLELPRGERWLSISGVGFEDGVVYAFRDLTEERALEQLRSEVVATVSHELRTPLAAIYGAALTLRREDIEIAEEQRAQLLALVGDEADRLARTVNDILWASRLDSATLGVAIESCDAATLVERVVTAAQTHVPEGIEIRTEANGELPPVAADPDKLHQVLVNLVDNAVKYSPDGGAVEVLVQPRGRMVQFAVRDEGLGIPNAEQRRIFDKFYRLDPQMTRGVGGTGLGLYICRELVRRMDGEIWVDSREGAGSTFAFELPVAAGSGA